MTGTMFKPTRQTKRRRLAGLIGVAVAVGGALAIPAYAGTAAAPRTAVQPAAAAPEVWEAFDDSRAMNGAAHAVFTLQVPAGSFTITAKLTANSSTGPADEAVECQLTAGNNFDRSQSLLDTPSDGETLALSVSHTFSAAGAITLECRHLFPGQGERTTLFFTKIEATRVNAITFVGL